MKIRDLKVGVHKVNVEGVAFNVSVVDHCGIKGIAGFQDGQKIPRKGKHLMLTENIRAWIEKMELDGPK